MYHLNQISKMEVTIYTIVFIQSQCSNIIYLHDVNEHACVYTSIIWHYHLAFTKARSI